MTRACAWHAQVDFIEKARRAEAAGSAAVVVVNYEEAEHSLMTMGMPKVGAASMQPMHVEARAWAWAST